MTSSYSRMITSEKSAECWFGNWFVFGHELPFFNAFKHFTPLLPCKDVHRIIAIKNLCSTMSKRQKRYASWHWGPRVGVGLRNPNYLTKHAEIRILLGELLGNLFNSSTLSRSVCWMLSETERVSTLVWHHSSRVIVQSKSCGMTMMTLRRFQPLASSVMMRFQPLRFSDAVGTDPKFFDDFPVEIEIIDDGPIKKSQCLEYVPMQIHFLGSMFYQNPKL